MAPQRSGSASVLSDDNTVANSVPTYNELLNELLKDENGIEIEVLLRLQGNRKRGWHDYQLVVHRSHEIVESLCRIPSGYTPERSGFNWNTFNVNGIESVVNFVTTPYAYGRFPTFKNTDRVVQATDAAIIVLNPSPYSDAQSMKQKFEEVKNSYEGRNLDSYRYFDELELFYPALSKEELVAVKERTHRPVAIVLLASKEGFIENTTRLSYEEALKVLRKACAEFMKDYGDANGVRFFEISDTKDQTGLNKVVTSLLSDLQEGRGIRFSPPIIRPWEFEHDKRFEILSSPKDNTSLWSRFNRFLTEFFRCCRRIQLRMHRSIPIIPREGWFFLFVCVFLSLLVVLTFF